MQNKTFQTFWILSLAFFAGLLPSAYALPDVLPQNISLSASTVAAGGTLTVTFNIRNQGTTSASATTTRLRLNQSSTTTGVGDTSLGDVSTPSIAAGGVASGLNRVVTIPSGTPAGTYYVWVVADNGSVLTQPNYANDYAHSAAFTITVTPTQPDVLPQNISLSASTVTAGGTLTVTFDIRNQGTGNAAATTTRLRLNQSSTTTGTGDTSLGDVSTPSISAGGVASGLNRVVTIPSGTPAGTYYVWVVADNGSVLTQPNYANDYARSVAFTVTAAQPDVLPQNISLSASTVEAGGTLTVTFDIRNQGGGNAGATTTRLRLNQSSTTTGTGDTSLGDVSTPSISAGGVASGLNRIVTIPSGTSAGTYYVWVVADNGSVLTQPNYANDYARSAAFTVTALPSPSITSVSPNPVTGSNSQQPFTINGNNFVSGCNVTLRDLTTSEVFPNRAMSSFSANQIIINPNFTTAAHSWSVEVINPGGASSGQFNFTVGAPAATPTITSVSPNPVTGSFSAQPFTILGNNFAFGCNVTLRDRTTGEPFPNRPISSFSANQIVINPNFTTDAHAWSVEVINPGGASSGQYNFNVVAPGGGNFYFSFPLQLNGWTAYTAPIVSVFDHSMSTPYTANSVVKPFTGENANIVDPSETPVGSLYSYKKAGGGTFLVGRANYVGTVGTGPTTLNYDGHAGFDYRVPTGTDVFAAADGEVVFTDPNNTTAAGKYVRLQHGNSGYQSQYLHLSEILVTVGQQVTRGQLIGRSGNTAGAGTVSPHLHFEAKRQINGQWVSVDPYGWESQEVDPREAAMAGLKSVNLWNGVAECNYVVTPVSRSHGPSADTGAFAVTAGAGCAWTATANAAWITVTGGGSGNGNGTVNYSVSASRGGGIRTGTITVQGITFTIAQSPVVGDRIYGVDVSSVGQGTITPSSWTQVKDSGKTFAWIRSSKGNADSDGNCRFVDPKFYNNIQNAKAAGLTVGAYHVGNIVQYSAVDEAAFFVSVAGDYIKPGHLRPVLDLESHSCGDPASLGAAALSTWVDQWATEVHRLTGVTPIIYSGQSFLANLQSSVAQKYDVWVAKYTDNPESSFTVPPWSDWTVFQYTDSGSVGGIPSIDLNVFRGSLVEFQNRLVIPNPQIVGVGGGGIQPPSSGQFQCEVLAPSQQQVIIQACDDLISWTDVATLIIVNGKATFTDSDAGTHTRRFYRPKP